MGFNTCPRKIALVRLMNKAAKITFVFGYAHYIKTVFSKKFVVQLTMIRNGFKTPNRQALIIVTIMNSIFKIKMEVNIMPSIYLVSTGENVGDGLWDGGSKNNQVADVTKEYWKITVL